MASRVQITKIHALKGALKLDDETYRATLAGYGVKTSTKLSFTKADQLISDLAQKAIASGVWEDRKPPRKAQPAPRRLADDPQSSMLRGLWIELHKLGAVKDPYEKALCSFVKRMTRKDALQWLSDRDVTKVKKALVDWAARVMEGEK